LKRDATRELKRETPSRASGENPRRQGDDVPLSVVVPVRDGGAQLARCLDALLASDFPSFELIVVDDGSTDGGASAGACRARGVEVVELARNRGPAAARNRGAERARGRVLLFVDADVVVRPDTLSRVVAFFDERPLVSAVFGSYDDEPAADNFVSQYKNLQHHFVHQQASERAETFWAGCGAVRRTAFEAVGGFDERRYTKPSVEDIELGGRLRRAGYSIALDKRLRVKHLKRWTLTSLLRADILDRALPWSRLILDGGGPLINDLNLRVRERVCAALVAAAALLLVPACFARAPYAALLAGASAAALATVFILNLGLFRFFRASRGAAFAAASFPLLVLYYLYGGAVFAFCYFERAFGKTVRAAPAVGRAAKLRRGRDA
jgi:GT2 family glycosyltransferase